MAVKVSVVVPVYNAGRYVEPCIESLLGQTLPPEELELIFVDDGSTDESPERLDRLAEEHANVRVIHIPNSGWPGKPRNIGVEAASGAYVQFVDQDDWVAEDALRRLYEMGASSDADIVLGKVASNFRGVPHGVFRQNRVRCTIHDAPLYDSLTPHKMFRRDFLRENGIAFPEGKRRLEDQLYMMQAYLAAKSVAILGDYTCYFYSRRDDGKNAGSARIDPKGYYGNLREVLDVIVDGTEPGEFRDRLLRRFYRVEMLGRLSEPSVVRYDPAYRREMFDEVRALAETYMTDGVRAGLDAMQRLRAARLEAGDLDGLVAVATAAPSVVAWSRLTSLAWQGPRLVVGVESGISTGSGPLQLIEESGRLFFDPRALGVESDRLDVTDEVGRWRCEVVLRDRDTAVEWSCTSRMSLATESGTPDGGAARVFRGEAVLEPGPRAGRDELARGSWDVYVKLQALGLNRRVRFGHDRVAGLEEACRPALLGKAPQIVMPYFTQGQPNLSLDIGRRRKRLTSALEGRASGSQHGHKVTVDLDLLTTPTTRSLPADLVIRGSEANPVSVSVPVRVVPADGRARVVVDLSRRLPGPVAGLRQGTWHYGIRLDAEGPDLALGVLRLGPGSGASGDGDLGSAARARPIRGRLAEVTEAARSLPARTDRDEVVRAVAYRLPQPVRTRLLRARKVWRARRGSFLSR